MRYQKEAEVLAGGGVGVMPTDTLYGVVGSAFSPGAVERIYALKGREADKPCIVLVASVKDVERFGASLEGAAKKVTDARWPGPVSIILPVSGDAFFYIHRGTGSIAFRLPGKPELREFLRASGPLVAPSANPEGMPPARTVDEARRYFGDTVDFYINGGELAGSPSELIRLRGEDVEVLREGR